MNEISDGHFIRHGPCEKCGSKDNVAWYSTDTGFCFGCGAVYNTRTVGQLHEHNTSKSSFRENTLDRRKLRSPPDDLSTYFSQTAVGWLRQYELTPADVIKHNVRWSPSREQLVYLFYGEGQDVVLWQARNFREGTDHKHRFFTGGTPADVIATYSSGKTGDTAVIVEDCISGIKIAMSGGGDGIPAFSAALSTQKVTRIAKLYKNIIVWLDHDKFGDAAKLSNRFKLLGCTSRVIDTTFDPKFYNLYEIGTYLK